MRRRFFVSQEMYDYLYIEALEDGLTFSITRDVEYSLDKENWEVLTAYDTSNSVTKGSKVYLKSEGTPSISDGSGQFTINAKCNVGGCPSSLIYGDGYKQYASFAVIYSFYGLFADNVNIIDASKLTLPATTLSPSCYSSMFDGCTSLTAAPELPATTLADYCYSFMFDGCTNLNYIKMLATDISAVGCLYHWVKGVASSGTFVKNSAMTSLPTGNSGIPSGWTVQNA